MEFTEILKIIASIIVILSAIISGLWAYTKFIVERAIIPPAQFDITAELIGKQKDDAIVEILLHLKNLGSSTLVVQSLWIDLLYLDKKEDIKLFNDVEDKIKCGRVHFSKSLRTMIGKDIVDAARNDELNRWIAHRKKLLRSKNNKQEKDRKPRGLPVMAHNTFVQPEVKQLFTYVTKVPVTTSIIMIFGEFYYASRPTHFQSFILYISKKLGLIQYSLRHLTMPHTCERVFSINKDF